MVVKDTTPTCVCSTLKIQQSNSHIYFSKTHIELTFHFPFSRSTLIIFQVDMFHHLFPKHFSHFTKPNPFFSFHKTNFMDNKAITHLSSIRLFQNNPNVIVNPLVTNTFTQPILTIVIYEYCSIILPL